jgi:hypothetical protein
MLSRMRLRALCGTGAGRVACLAALAAALLGGGPRCRIYLRGKAHPTGALARQPVQTLHNAARFRHLEGAKMAGPGT